jgi:hypothetical protein
MYDQGNDSLVSVGPLGTPTINQGRTPASGRDSGDSFFSARSHRSVLLGEEDRKKIAMAQAVQRGAAGNYRPLPQQGQVYELSEAELKTSGFREDSLKS